MSRIRRVRWKKIARFSAFCASPLFSSRVAWRRASGRSIQMARGRFFHPRLRFDSIEELNGWLETECRRWADTHRELTVA